MAAKTPDGVADWDSTRLGLAVAAARLRNDDEGLQALAGGEEISPAVLELIDGLVNALVQRILNRRNARAWRDDPDVAASLATQLDTWVRSLTVDQ